MFRKNSSKLLPPRPTLRYRSSACIHHNLNMNLKNINPQKQRLIPLTSELMANNLSSYCLGDKEFLEPLSNLIKTEVTNCMNELKGDFACKSDFNQIRKIVANHVEFTKRNETITDGSENSELDAESTQSTSDFELLESKLIRNGEIKIINSNKNSIGDARILDNNQISSNKKDELNTNTKNLIPNCDNITVQASVKKIKDIDLRLKCLESKMDLIHTTLKEIQVTNQNDIASLRYENTTKINAINDEINSIQLDLDTCLNDDQGFESKLQDIESKVKQSLYESEHNMKKPISTTDNWERINKYDEMFYELRQLKMNELCYKKSKRSIYLNHRPHINQFVPPPQFNPVSDSRRELRTPRFVETQ